ncbi:unnamed protein product [Diplocarpon coronariae]|nr:hypothetical protein JHW43_009321 [Diplocarpon mali]
MKAARHASKGLRASRLMDWTSSATKRMSGATIVVAKTRGCKRTGNQLERAEEADEAEAETEEAEADAQPRAGTRPNGSRLTGSYWAQGSRTADVGLGLERGRGEEGRQEEEEKKGGKRKRTRDGKGEARPSEASQSLGDSLAWCSEACSPSDCGVRKREHAGWKLTAVRVSGRDACSDPDSHATTHTRPSSELANRHEREVTTWTRTRMVMEQFDDAGAGAGVAGVAGVAVVRP